MKFGGILLIVSDMNKAKDFYERVMEQVVTLDLGEHVSFENGFGLQTNYKAIIGHELEPVRQSNNFQLYFEVQDVEQWELKIEKLGEIDFLHPLKEYAWGQRTFRFYDFDRNIVEVAENMEHVVTRLFEQGLSALEISKRTMYPIEFVERKLNI